MMTTSRKDIQVAIERLAEALSGRLDIESGADLFHPDLVVHLDGLTFRGISAWKSWVGYLRSREGMESLEISCDGIADIGPGIVTAFGRWRVWDGSGVREMNAAATYRFHEGRIAEVWTTRANYEMMFGPAVRSRAGLMVVLVRVLVWARFRRGRMTPPIALGKI